MTDQNTLAHRANTGEMEGIDYQQESYWWDPTTGTWYWWPINGGFEEVTDGNLENALHAALETEGEQSPHSVRP